MSDAIRTGDKILLAAIDLMSVKGYHGTSTKEIAAAAGVNEVTLFRHFGNKMNLLGAAFDRFHYADEMTRFFREELVGDLQLDLLAISRAYHTVMNRNKKLIRIALKEAGGLPDIHKQATRHPLKLKQLLTEYLISMSDKGKVVLSNPELQALSFMWMNYGAFVTSLNSEDPNPAVPLEAFIEESVRLFARALSP